MENHISFYLGQCTASRSVARALEWWPFENAGCRECFMPCPVSWLRHSRRSMRVKAMGGWSPISILTAT
jgi:hypothetical protein